VNATGELVRQQLHTWLRHDPERDSAWASNAADSLRNASPFCQQNLACPFVVLAQQGQVHAHCWEAGCAPPVSKMGDVTWQTCSYSATNPDCLPPPTHTFCCGSVMVLLCGWLVVCRVPSTAVWVPTACLAAPWLRRTWRRAWRQDSRSAASTQRWAETEVPSGTVWYMHRALVCGGWGGHGQSFLGVSAAAACRATPREAGATCSLLIDGCCCCCHPQVMPGQWEYQIGPVGPLELGDEVMLSRWLLHRLGKCIAVTLRREGGEGGKQGTGGEAEQGGGERKRQGGRGRGDGGEGRGRWEGGGEPRVQGSWVSCISPGSSTLACCCTGGVSDFLHHMY
jgi:hypothetical protein